MTTITIEENIKLKSLDFKTYDELVNFIIYDNTNLEIDAFTKDEEDFLNGLNSFKNFKNIANSLGV